METSPTIKELAGALQKFQKSAPAITKDAKANYGKYATFGNVVETIKEPLAAQGLSFSQFPDADGLTTIIMHTSGEWLRSTATLHLDKQTPQGQGSAITYMKRYALSAALGLATDDDDDANVASAPAKAPVAAKTAPVAPAKRQNPPVFKSDAIKEQEAKRRIAMLVDKLADGVVPDFATDDEGKKARAEWYASEVQRLTSLSLPLASLADLEAIGDELGKLFDQRI